MSDIYLGQTILTYRRHFVVFFVISDIHGSSTSLEAALKIYKSGNFDKLIICGDILYHGARNPLPEGYNPKRVIQILNEVKSDILAVRGNCDSEVDSMVLEFPVKADYSLIITKERELFITHGHLYGPENIPPIKKNCILVAGHTHIPEIQNIDDIYYYNPGSISLPKGGYKASYGVITSSRLEVFELDSGKLIKSASM